LSESKGGLLWFELLGAWLAAVAARAAALIWELAQMNILTLRVIAHGFRIN